MSNDLRIKKKHHGDDDQGWDCPSCGESSPHGAVICVNCGYDKRTGRRTGEPRTKMGLPIGRIITTAVVLGLVGAGAYVLLNRHNESGGPVVSEARPAPATEAATPAASAKPAPPLAPTTVVAVVESEGAEGEGSRAAAAEAHEIGTTPAMSAEAREQLALRIDQRFPLFAEGEAVALRMTNGIMRRGAFKGLDGSNVVVAAASGETSTIPVTSLDIASRLRCDPEYRVRYVDYWSQRGAKTAAGPK
jgi:hypothetical protein